MITNEYERDLNDTSSLNRPGRVDLVVFQNTADAGDGHPGLQRCFRNYLHEGGIEKDIQLLGYSILGTSVDINNAELQQLSNISGTTISAEQWVFVGEADQAVKQNDSPTFISPIVTNLNLGNDIIHVGDTNNLISFGTDTQTFQTGGGSRMDISDSGVRFGGANVRITGIINNDSLGTSDVVLCTQGNVKAYADIIAGNLSTHEGSTGASHTYINQDLKTTFSPTFVGLTLSANLVTTSTVDGVDVSGIRLNSMPTAADGDINANTNKITNVVDPTTNQEAATKKYVDDSMIVKTLNTTIKTTTEDDYTKVKEILIQQSGSFTFYWEFRNYTAYDCYTKLYVDGVARGVEKFMTTDTFLAVNDTITVVAGELIQIYAKGQIGQGSTVGVRGFYVNKLGNINWDY